MLCSLHTTLANLLWPLLTMPGMLSRIAVPGILSTNAAVFVAWRVSDSPRDRRFMMQNFTLSSDGCVRGIASFPLIPCDLRL